ncbi:MAG: HPF/RaiA family ribosome-associated protein [Verrucomicrobia bacterium]|nr:HPF/RaiA family ribosome-associated protein [Verrucomicrobiota bacterium]
MTLAWNIVSKHIRPHEQLQQKIREKIAKLEQHLQHFPPDAVHLLISLERHPRTGVFRAGLTLRLPSNILHSVKTAKGDPVPAFDKAVRAMLRELEDLKSELRREDTWRQRGRRAELRAMKPLRFTNEPHPVGPQTLADTLAEMIKRYHGRLLYHAQRELHRDQEDGEVPRGAIKPEVVVDEVVRQALIAPGKKPEDVSYRLWLYSLLRRELKRRYRRLRVDGERNVPIEEMTLAPEDAELNEGYDAEQPLGIIAQRLAPTLVSRGDQLPDTHLEDPAAVAEEHDLIDYLHRVTASWPEKERAVFDLHFLEGFDENEVAMLEGLQRDKAKAMIDDVQLRLRGVLLQATGRWVEARTVPAQASR